MNSNITNKKYDEFYNLYKEFQQKKGFNSIFEAFGVGNIPLNNIKNNGTLLVAEYNNEMLVGNYYIEDESNIMPLISVSKRLDADKEKSMLIASANRLLHWEAIKYAKEKQIKEFDFGGLFSEEEAEKDLRKKGVNNF
jgi:hypothetical protein